jgi:AbrB family looped-hinge helix DNA binding protein
MPSDEPDVTTVTSKGQITIPSNLRNQYGIEQGTKLMIVPTEVGLVLRKVELPSVTEFQQRVKERAETVDLSEDEVTQLVHEARSTEE